MLSSRILIWQGFKPMTAEQVLDTIPAFHPVWENADPDLIAYTDDTAAHGNFRNWATVTHHLQLAMARSNADKVDSSLLQWVFSRMS